MGRWPLATTSLAALDARVHSVPNADIVGRARKAGVGSDHIHSRSWTVAGHFCHDFDAENDSFPFRAVWAGHRRGTSVMQRRRRRRTLSPGRWQGRWRAVASIVVAGAVVISGCDIAPDVADGDPQSTIGSTEATSAPETTAAPTTPAATSDPASQVIDRFLEALNAQDDEKMAGVFGDDVVLTRPSGQVSVGADAVTWWQQNFGRETGERITDAFHASDGRRYFLLEFTVSSGASPTFVCSVEMDGEQLVNMDFRDQSFEEVIATREFDDLYQALNDQDLERLTEEFDGITYTSPSGEELTGAEAAEHWADAFGVTVARTTGVFAIGDDAYGFATEHSDPDTGVSTAYSVEIETSGGQILSMTERRSQS